jgi:hypothetical protein
LASRQINPWISNAPKRFPEGFVRTSVSQLLPVYLQRKGCPMACTFGILLAAADWQNCGNGVAIICDE